MSKTPYMPLWVSDFLGDTLDLNAKEVGAYMLLLMALWQHRGTLPHDEKKLKRVARIGRDWPSVWASLERFFVVENGQISNARLTQELTKVAHQRAVNAHSGARGGRAKALKSNNPPLANALAAITITNKQEETPPLPPVNSAEESDDAKRENGRGETPDDGQGSGVASAPPGHEPDGAGNGDGPEPGGDRRDPWEDFRLTKARRAIARGQGVAAGDIDGQFARFIDQQQTTAAMVRDPDEAWRRYCVGVGRHRAPGSNSTCRGSRTADAFRKALAKREADRLALEQRTPDAGAWLTDCTYGEDGEGR